MLVMNNVKVMWAGERTTDCLLIVGHNTWKPIALNAANTDLFLRWKYYPHNWVSVSDIIHKMISSFILFKLILFLPMNMDYKMVIKNTKLALINLIRIT